MHLVVLYCYQGAATDPEQLALTDQLFDAALAELSVVARGFSHVYWLVISTWSPPKSIAWQKGFRLGSGLILKVLGLWLLVGNLVGVSGVLLVVLVVILWLVALFWLLLF